MKHLALRSRSVRNRNRPFTAPGLGDRIHGAITGWVYGQRHGTPVTLHLTADKVRGGQFQNKGESWAEVIRLFPEGSLAFMVHPVSGLEEPDGVAYLRKHGIDAERLRGFPRPISVARGARHRPVPEGDPAAAGRRAGHRPAGQVRHGAVGLK